MMIAEWKGQVIAQSDQTIVVEGNHYFPADSVIAACLEASEHRSACHWKGEAHYFDVVVAGQRNENAAWFYPQPKEAADKIKNYVAFWKGVTVSAAS